MKTKIMSVSSALTRFTAAKHKPRDPGLKTAQIALKGNQTISHTQYPQYSETESSSQTNIMTNLKGPSGAFI